MQMRVKQLIKHMANEKKIHFLLNPPMYNTGLTSAFSALACHLELCRVRHFEKIGLLRGAPFSVYE